MARGARRTGVEKVEDQLNEVRFAIDQYNDCINVLKEQEKSLLQNLENEHAKVISSLLRGSNITMEQLKEMIEENKNLKRDQSEIDK